jgi:hypothetical protein
MWEQDLGPFRTRDMSKFSGWIAYCSLAVLIALYVVGAVSHGSLRHEVQTLPLWFTIVLGFRGGNLPNGPLCRASFFGWQ